MPDAADVTTRAEQHERLPAEAEARWLRFGRSNTLRFPELLGFVVEDVRVDYCRMRLPYRAELLQAQGIVHGGAIASLLDSVLVPAVGGVLGPSVRYATVDFHVQFIGSLTDEDAVAEGWVTRRGRSVVFCESEAFGATSGRRIAKSVLTYNVSDPR